MSRLLEVDGLVSSVSDGVNGVSSDSVAGDTALAGDLDDDGVTVVGEGIDGVAGGVRY